ncbi:MAG: hypothetical protein WDA53_08800 [Bacillota bacterium]
MKKHLMGSLFILIILIVLGCSTQQGVSGPDTQKNIVDFNPNKVAINDGSKAILEGKDFPAAEISPDSALSGYTESVPGGIHIDLAVDELISKYDSFYEYISDEGGTGLIIWTDIELRDFAFIFIDQHDTDDGLSLLPGDKLFSVEKLSSEKPFVVTLLTPGLVPAYGVSFLDENNARRYFAINLDGRGEDEAPPYFLLEFCNI